MARLVGSLVVSSAAVPEAREGSLVRSVRKVANQVSVEAVMAAKFVELVAWDVVDRLGDGAAAAAEVALIAVAPPAARFLSTLRHATVQPGIHPARR